MIFDDFREGWGGNYDWTNLRQIMAARAFPNAKWVQLTGNEPIFDSFFKIDMKAAVVGRTSAYGTQPPTYWGDLSGQRSEEAPDGASPTSTTTSASRGSGRRRASCPIASANETYKLGINYMIYALTH